MNKLLICYFSATGTTKEVAEKLSKITNGDLFEIKPVTPYTSEDLDWTNKQSRTSLEYADPNIRPEISSKITNINEYNKIIVGFPVWWYKEPNIIDTFFENNNITNQEVYIYVTSGGSGVKESFESLKSKYPTINFISGKRLSSSDINDPEIISWLNN